ncbi:retrovirus-related pol polyprotein from transposon 17.6 [Plakobranchus ocellatus]|uniref:Retrovirus-related pol polyprotein from transposon 17.6 n=1 Tax=Plakobranchus ocellatus TaxID=259542 RepID=A0AAV4CEL9_9GAST|nr:retrovirus-related pol polyprotein from transposon 17.6 [Plakobranchus ocellatus]
MLTTHALILVRYHYVVRPYFLSISVSSVEISLSVDTVVDKELHPHRDSDFPFCETICFAKPTAYVSTISEEDGGEIGLLVTTPPLASESGTVVIDPSLSSSQTDHKPLSYLRAGSPKNARLMRWASALQEFSFQVVHIPGSENVHADVLSRLY